MSAEIALSYGGDGGEFEAATIVVPFAECACLPEPGDNVAIARKVVESGTAIRLPPGETDVIVTINARILEGHRFAVCPIAPGEKLLSWGLPFGEATAHIPPGGYVINERMLTTLEKRTAVDFPLPETPNFIDQIVPHDLDEAGFVSAEQVPLYPLERRSSAEASFMGFPREAGRGVGTRNYVVVIAVTSRSGAFARAIERSLAEASRSLENVDGVVAIAHTEAGGSEVPLNVDFVKNVLAGCLVHMNVGAALVVDFGAEMDVLTGADIREHVSSKFGEAVLDAVPHRFMTLSGDWSRDLAEAESTVRVWLPAMNADSKRVPCPLSEIRIALQCGGSDAFSGVSGNPVAGWCAKEIIHHGGAAVLAETDELIGAESYILSKVRDLETARRFIGMVERYKALCDAHGQSAEGNPSGGNNFRGLYNITLKSLGAAKKKHADVRLDDVLEYGERRCEGRGYYFMNSPGNDLESIAGQVATGCNVIFFTTGNGSITNFPFVPTLKLITTTGRYDMLSREMDFNAGQFQDGLPMDECGRRLFDLMVETAGGRLSKGERHRHSQISIWRAWAQPPTEAEETEQQQRSGCGVVDSIAERPRGSAALEIKRNEEGVAAAGVPTTVAGFAASDPDAPAATDSVGLILPTSLCSSQIAVLVAQRLNSILREEGEEAATIGRCVTRFVALPHTEGCGCGTTGNDELLFPRTMLGHLLHPSVSYGLLLEHGCEKAHNDYFAGHLNDMQQGAGGDARASFGWASVQLDGGIDSVIDKCTEYFRSRTAAPAPSLAQRSSSVPLSRLKIGLASSVSASSRKPSSGVPPVPPEIAATFVALSQYICGGGGSVVVPSNDLLLSSSPFLDDLLETRSLEPTLAFGQRLSTVKGGCHIMSAESRNCNSVEVVTGLCATGVDVVLVFSEIPVQGHPFVPVLQVAASCGQGTAAAPLFADLVIDTGRTRAASGDGLVAASDSGKVATWLQQVLPLLAGCASRTYVAKSSANVDFQIMRGNSAVSL